MTEKQCMVRLSRILTDSVKPIHFTNKNVPFIILRLMKTAEGFEMTGNVKKMCILNVLHSFMKMNYISVDIPECLFDLFIDLDKKRDTIHAPKSSCY